MQEWCLWKEREKEGGLGRKSLRLMQLWDSLSQAYQMPQNKTDHWRNPMLGRNGLVLACLQCSLTERRRRRDDCGINTAIHCEGVTARGCQLTTLFPAGSQCGRSEQGTPPSCHTRHVHTCVNSKSEYNLSLSLSTFDIFITNIYWAYKKYSTRQLYPLHWNDWVWEGFRYPGKFFITIIVNTRHVLFSWAPKSLWTVTAATELKDACSLKEKLWQT